MSDDLINPAGIPQFTGNLETLETDAAALVTQAGHFRSSGASVNTEFHGLSAFYKAPEAEQLFATTVPVATKADAFARDLEKVASALRDYGGEVRPIVARLQSLTLASWTFVQSIEDDGDWREDKKKVQHNNDLWHDVNATLDAFWAAERSCYAAITALVGGAPLIPDDGTHQQNMYGYRAEDLDHAEETPWGSTTDRDYSGWAWVAHQVKSYVWDGFVIDGLWATIKGLGTLVGKDGWDAAGKAWTGLAKLATGLAIIITPVVGTFFMAIPEDKLPGWVSDSRKALKETGKALIAYDQWDKNPARAAGAVTFNVITAIFTEGAGNAAKGGAVAKTLSVLGKTGRALDPVTYVIAGGKFAVVKVGDLLSGLKNLRTGVLVDTAAGYRLPDLDDALTPPPAGLPANTVRLIDHEGRTVYLDSVQGTLFDDSGKVIQHADDIRREPSAAERGAEQDPLPHREPVLVGARPGTHAGDDLATTGHAPGGIAHDLGRVDQTGHASGSDHGTGDGGGGGHDSGQHTGSGSGGSHEAQPPHGQQPQPFSRETMRQQVERANNDPAWFKENYNRLGRRRFITLDGGYGQRLPQLAADPARPGKWVAASDLPPAIQEKYLRRYSVIGRRGVSDDTLKYLDREAAKRDQALIADRAAEDRLKAAEKAYEANPSQELLDVVAHLDATHSPLHGQMGRTAEMFGENVAEYHAIPENYPHAERVDDGALGRDRFDQVYRTTDGRYVVVEAKGSERVSLGTRMGHTGQRVTQGTREYFETILNEMDKRAEKASGTPAGDAEQALADQLRDALRRNKVDYVLVHAESKGTQYAGYQMKQFDISS